MNIGIDGFEANTEKRVGIGRYAYQLLTELSKLDGQNSYTIFLPQQPLPDMPPPKKNWQYVVGRLGSFWTVRQLPGLIKKQPLDLFFSPTHYAPWFSSVPKILSIMDLSYLHYPYMFRKKDLIQLKYMGGYSIKRANQIFTISEFSKSEIVKFYKKRTEDVVVTYPGINYSRQKMLKHVQHDKVHKGKPFILFVGTIQPRKNIVRLIEAFEQLKEEALLVIVGKRGWLYEPILKRMEESKKSKDIVYLDFVGDEELATLYTQARCFTLPSLYEGFGIPVADAMSYGCPVVVSDTTSLPEVAGEAGIYVDPLNIDSIAGGLHKALQLTETERMRLVNKGKEHIQKFSWEACARKTLEVFKSL